MKLRFFSSVIWVKSKFNFCGLSCSYGILYIFKKTQIYILFINIYLSYIASAFSVNGYACSACRVCYSSCQVSRLLCKAHVSQIFNLIIKSISVNMINCLFWPFSCFIKPNKSVHQNFMVINRALEIFVSVKSTNVAKYAASLNTITCRNFPKKSSSMLIIGQNFIYSFFRKHGKVIAYEW